MKLNRLFGVLLFLFLCVSLFGQGLSCNDDWFEGEGTHYGGVAGSAGGHCGIPVATGDFYHAALNHVQYAASQACGSCVRIIGPKGEVTLKIVDECPECQVGDIDMTTTVFPQLAQLKDGRIKIKWQFVPCPMEQGMSVVFAPGSGPYYFKAQFRDFVYPLALVEYRKVDGSYEAIGRQPYNYFVQEGGIEANILETGPYHFRLTSVTGQVLEMSNIGFDTSAPVQTRYQFPLLPCPDCAGVLNGTAQIDNCGVCSGGTTGIEVNTYCQKDCNDYWEGTAFVDSCGKCVAGSTGATPCGDDCAGQPGGMAFLDNCENCVSGMTGLTACYKDCHNEWGGSAAFDSCGTCAGGNTGKKFVDRTQDCLVSSLDSEISLVSDQVLLYPNPFSNSLVVKASIAGECRMVDMSGAILKTGRIGETWDTVLWPKGIYFLLLETNNGLQVAKAMKQ